MPTTTRKPVRSTGARKRSNGSEPAALRRLNKSLDQAQDALKALRKDVSKDVSAGAKNLYTDLERFVKDARRDSGKLTTALQRDLERVQKKLASPRKTAPKRTAKKSAGTSRRASASGKR